MSDIPVPHYGPTALDLIANAATLSGDPETGSALQRMAQEWSADRLAMQNAITRANDLEHRLDRTRAAIRGDFS